jgi:hypothetical protein
MLAKKHLTEVMQLVMRLRLLHKTSTRDADVC